MQIREIRVEPKVWRIFRQVTALLHTSPGFWFCVFQQVKGGGVRRRNPGSGGGESGSEVAAVEGIEDHGEGIGAELNSAYGLLPSLILVTARRG